MLGPPRLTKLLFEAFLCSRLRPTVRALAEAQAKGLATEAHALVQRDGALRSHILCVRMGMPTDNIWRAAESYIVRGHPHPDAGRRAAVSRQPGGRAGRAARSAGRGAARLGGPAARAVRDLDPAGAGNSDAGGTGPPRRPRLGHRPRPDSPRPRRAD